MTWLLIINRPGFLPESEPLEFDTWQDAIDGASDEMDRAYNEGDATAAALAKADSLLMDAVGRVAMAESDGEPVCVMFDGFAYDIQRGA